MKLRALLVPALVALSLALASCGGGDDTDETTAIGGGNGTAATEVEIVEFAYDPDPIEVEAGSTVSWTNEDSAPHTATADDGSFDTDTLDKGKTGKVTFEEAGTFPYFCEIHPTMHGTVEVSE
ncbi:MAG TPA: cupredoxin family copper-binding protein [Solirubrobacterales bacterium]|nr:cupredoxin family copper-binding protein [Solirubrobacterales bacterium]